MHHYSYYSYGPEIAVAVWFVVIIILTIVACIVGQILFALAVYNNAKSRCNENAVMWGVLTGFFGWIPAVIYLCTRNSARDRLIICSKCGATHPVSWLHCSSCGMENVYAQQFNNPLAEHQAKLSKKLLIAAIVLIGASILAIIISVIVLVGVAATYYY